MQNISHIVNCQQSRACLQEFTMFKLTMRLIYILILMTFGGCVQAQGWQHAGQFDTTKIPPPLLPWLTDSKSMTARMEKRCKKIEIEIIKNQTGLMTPEENKYLKAGINNRAWIREVIMRCDSKPWLYGRTVIPFSESRTLPPEIRNLQNIPLGKVLFADPNTTRSAFEFSRTKRLPNDTQSYWARRSIFYYKGQPLLLTEIFLPEMINSLQI